MANGTDQTILHRYELFDADTNGARLTMFVFESRESTLQLFLKCYLIEELTIAQFKLHGLVLTHRDFCTARISLNE